MSRLPSPRVLIAAGLCAGFLFAAGVAALSGSGSGGDGAAAGTTPAMTEDTTTATTATVEEPGEPSVTVPTTSAPATTAPPTSSTPQTTTRPDGGIPPARPQTVSRPPLQLLPVKPNLSTVSWPDKQRVAEVALSNGNLLAAIDGRNRPRLQTLRKLRASVAPNVLRQINEIWATNPPAASAPPTRGRVTAMSLHDDPQTGARYVTMPYFRIENGRRSDAVMILEFAPARAIVTGYTVA